MGEVEGVVYAFCFGEVGDCVVLVGDGIDAAERGECVCLGLGVVVLVADGDGAVAVFLSHVVDFLLAIRLGDVHKALCERLLAVKQGVNLKGLKHQIHCQIIHPRLIITSAECGVCCGNVEAVARLLRYLTRLCCVFDGDVRGCFEGVAALLDEPGKLCAVGLRRRHAAHGNRQDCCKQCCEDMLYFFTFFTSFSNSLWDYGCYFQELLFIFFI